MCVYPADVLVTNANDVLVHFINFVKCFSNIGTRVKSRSMEAPTVLSCFFLGGAGSA